MIKLQNLWERQAKKQMTLHPTAKEYSPLLVLAVIGKIFTMLLSVTGGVLYFTGVFKGLYVPLVVFLSASLLLLLEGLNLFTLSKALKMGLRSKPVPSVILSVFSLVLFAISFFITTEGVKQWKTEEASQQTEISKDFEAEKTELKNSYAKRIERLQNAIAPLEQYAWKSQQVAIYNQRIDSLEKTLAVQIQNLERKEKQAQESDRHSTDKQATKYWAIGVGLMVFQLVFNVVIAVLYNRIHKENNETQRIDEELNQLRETRLSNFYTQVKNDFAGLENLFLQRLALIGNTPALAVATVTDSVEKLSTDKKEEPKKTTDHGAEKEEAKPTPIGFHVPSPNESRIDASRNNETRINETRYNNTDDKEPIETQKVKYTRICPNCNTGFIHKHHMQKYCSTACRVQYWEKKTGRKLKYKKSK